MNVVISDDLKLWFYASNNIFFQLFQARLYEFIFSSQNPKRERGIHNIYNLPKSGR
jgi:hypothetical protein